MARMSEEQFKRINLWQTEAATIPNNFERYCRAQELFGGDPNYSVWPSGKVYAVCQYTDDEHAAQITRYQLQQ